MFSNYMKISESGLAQGLKTSTKQITDWLKHLDKLQAISYLPIKDQPQVTFVIARQDAAKLPVDRKRLEAVGHGESR